MTPENIFVQMKFKTPLDVSQGVLPDIVRVKMLVSLFMVEDLKGIYSEWNSGDRLE
jgi:hypothetical protein